MTGLRIGVDLDDICFPWSDWAQVACDETGISRGLKIDRWNFHETFGVSRDELWNDVLYPAYRRGMLLQAPYEGVAGILRALQDEYGHEVHFATARGFEGALGKLVREQTIWALDRYDLDHRSLTFTQDKTLLNVDAFLDDSPANCQAMRAAGCGFVAMRRQPHNAHLRGVGTDYLQVDDLEHFAALIEPTITQHLSLTRTASEPSVTLRDNHNRRTA